jgi:hypothetical protein
MGIHSPPHIVQYLEIFHTAVASGSTRRFKGELRISKLALGLCLWYLVGSTLYWPSQQTFGFHDPQEELLRHVRRVWTCPTGPLLFVYEL